LKWLSDLLHSECNQKLVSMPLDVEEAVSDQNCGYVENYSFENMFEVVNMTQMQMSSDEDSDSVKHLLKLILPSSKR